MNRPPRYRLTAAEKDALLDEQAALIERLAARIAELEAALTKPKKTSSNSHTPPSQDGPGRRNRKRDTESERRRTPRPSRPGTSRPLADEPDKAERRMADACPHCGADVSGDQQSCRHRHDHVELPRSARR